MNKMLAIPERHEFHAGQFDEFIALMRDVDQHTVRMTIGAASDIELDEGGRLKNGGFALAPLAIQQICKQVSKGLWSLVADIAGVNRSSRAYDSVVSIPLATRIINDCVALRFRAADGICGRDMLQDHTTRVVEGVVGPRYQLLPNHQLLEAVRELMDSHEMPMKFHAGLLAGRRMAASFLTEEPLVDIDGPVFGGAYFSNSEAGECGVRGATILQFGQTMRCMNRLRHIAHSGRDFLKRLSTMLGSVMGSWEQTVRVASQASSVMERELNLLTSEEQLNRAKRIKMQAKLADYVDKSLAEDVVRKAIFMGASGTHIPRNVPPKDIASRRVRDVVIMLMRAADGQYPEIRERLERAAFDILAGKITF